jgi:hypothetical protein
LALAAGGRLLHHLVDLFAEDDVFAYLLNGSSTGRWSCVAAAWSLAGRVGSRRL